VSNWSNKTKSKHTCNSQALPVDHKLSIGVLPNQHIIFDSQETLSLVNKLKSSKYNQKNAQAKLTSQQGEFMKPPSDISKFKNQQSSKSKWKRFPLNPKDSLGINGIYSFIKISFHFP